MPKKNILHQQKEFGYKKELSQKRRSHHLLKSPNPDTRACLQRTRIFMKSRIHLLHSRKKHSNGKKN
jgi:hypothetical protein